MLDLNKIKITSLFNFEDAVIRIREAYIASSEDRVQTPNVVHLAFPATNGDCHIKSGHINESESYVIKIASGFYDNPKQGLPSSNGLILAFSAKTGEPLAILRDEGWLTDIRTGIGGALATLALARPDATRVLIIGTGIQAKMQVECLSKMAPDRAFEFSIWGRSNAHSSSLADDLTLNSLSANAVSNLDDAVKNADIIITTTPSKTPLFDGNLVKSGTHITAVGADSPGKQELPTPLVTDANLRVCDMSKQSLAHGEFQHSAADQPTIDVIELGQILSKKHSGRTSSNDITIADLTGIAAQDIAVTQSILNAASL